MKIQALSDLHLEHGGAVPPHVPGADVIVLAGDLAPHCEGLVERLRDHWATAPHILYVLGNHEFCGTEIDETRARLAKECREAGIHLLDPGTVQIDPGRSAEGPNADRKMFPATPRARETHSIGNPLLAFELSRVARDAPASPGSDTRPPHPGVARWRPGAP